MKTVVEFVDRWDCGGIVSYIVNLVTNIDLTKYKIRIVCGQKDYNGYDERLAEKGIYVESILDCAYDSAIKRTIETRKKFCIYLCKKMPDIIHLHVSNGIQLGWAKYAKKIGISKIIVHSHNSGLGDGSHLLIKKVGHFIGKYIYQKYADNKIACSDLAAWWLYSKKVIECGRVNICSCIVDIDKFKFSKNIRNEMRRNLNIENELVFITVGRMSYQKNQLFLLYIYSKLIMEIPNSRLIIVGTGELHDEMQNKANKLNLKSKIIWIEHTQEVWKFMNMADVFLLPSLFEGNPLVGIEAQACGLQCFFSDRITRQAKILGNARFLDLCMTSENWAKSIISELDMLTENGRIEANQIWGLK